MFGLLKKDREKKLAKERTKKAKKTAERIDRNSMAVMKRVMKETEEIRRQDAIFEACYPIYQKGEEARKAGNLATAISYFEQARRGGYVVPALYESYAMTYRKMNDIPKEIAIIEEGIRELTKINGKVGDMSTGFRDLTERLEKAKAKLK